MNFLKKTLGKQDQKKQSRSVNTTNPNPNPLKKNKQIWSNIDEMIEGKSDRKNKVEEFDQNAIRIFREFDESRKLLDEGEFEKTLKSLTEEYNSWNKVKISMTTETNECATFENIQQKLEQLLSSGEDIGNKNLILLFSEKLKKHIKQIRKSEKDKKLKQFDTMVSFMSMKKKPTKIIQSSDNDFIIKVTKQQYTLQSKKKLSKKKSLGTLHSANSGSLEKSSNYRNSLSKKGSEGDINHVKLQNLLLKDGSLKVVKAVKYDYSAIFERSAANIQRRNNATNNPTIKKEQSRPIEKVKKNEGFVFFRPNLKK